MKTLALMLLPLFALAESGPGIFDQPLEIAPPEFSAYAEQKLITLFGELKNSEVMALDGWVSLIDGRLADHATLIYMATVDPKYTMNSDLRVGLALGARGSEELLLLEPRAKRWMPLLWESVCVVDARKTEKEIDEMVDFLRKKFTSLDVQVLNEINIITLSGELQTQGNFTTTREKALESTSAYKHLQQLGFCSSIEIGRMVFRIPNDFTELHSLRSKDDRFDLNAFRTVSKTMAYEGWSFTTLPAFPPPFGDGPKGSK